MLIAMPKIINKAKVACLDFSLQKAKMHLGVSIVVDDPEKLTAIRERYALFNLETNLRLCVCVCARIHVCVCSGSQISPRRE